MSLDIRAIDQIVVFVIHLLCKACAEYFTYFDYLIGGRERTGTHQEGHLLPCIENVRRRVQFCIGWYRMPGGRGCARKVAAVAARSEETRLNSSHVAISYAVFCL